MEAQRVGREDQAVLQGHGVPGNLHAQEEGDVADHVAGPEDLEDDPPAAEIAGELDRAAADDVDARRCLSHPEHGRAGGVVVLAEQSGEFVDVVRLRRGQFGGAQPFGDPLGVSVGQVHRRGRPYQCPRHPSFSKPPI